MKSSTAALFVSILANESHTVFGYAPNKARKGPKDACKTCGAFLPPGKAGRKCRACRGLGAAPIATPPAPG